LHIPPPLKQLSHQAPHHCLPIRRPLCPHLPKPTQTPFILPTIIPAITPTAHPQAISIDNASQIKQIGQLWEGPTGEVRAIAFAPLPSGDTNAYQLLVGYTDGQVILWDVLTQTSRRHFEGHTQQINHVAFSPDGQMLVSSSNDGTPFVATDTLPTQRSNAQGLCFKAAFIRWQISSDRMWLSCSKKMGYKFMAIAL
jgi:hypothetical protein